MLQSCFWRHDCESLNADKNIHLSYKENYKLISSDQNVVIKGNFYNSSNAADTCIIQCPDEVMLSKESRL